MTLRYVALGDSYTVGTSVAAADRWPDRLIRALGGAADGEPALTLVANLAALGRTSGDVLRGQMPRLQGLAPGFVTLQIGVNDVVQGISAERYCDNVAAILHQLLNLLPENRLVIVNTPDYTVTPAGSEYGDPALQHGRILEANGVLLELATSRGIALVDIFDISGLAAVDQSLVARDGLHPSASQYALWVGRIEPVVSRLLDGG